MAQVVLVKLLMPQGDSLFQLIGEKCGLVTSDNGYYVNSDSLSFAII